MLDALRATLAEMWQTNDFLNGGLVLMALGALLAALRNVPRHILAGVRRRWVVTTEIRRAHELSEWVSWWIGRELEGLHRKNLKASLRHVDDADEPEVVYEPGYGFHFFVWRRRLYVVTRELSEEGKQMGVAEDVYRISTLSRTARPVRDMLEAARSDAISHARRSQRVFYSMPGHWQTLRGCRPRPLETVIFPAGVAESIVSECREFLASRDWYLTRGLPYRRGYLLYGPPGSGKSSFVQALATELDLPLYWLNLSQPRMSDGSLIEIFGMMRQRAILLIEDLDCSALERASQGPPSDEAPSVTLRGLSNALDGVVAPDGRLLFVTTNRRDLIDPALLRPGRVDAQHEIGDATPEQAGRLFLRFFPGETVAAERFAGALPSEISMAELQELLVAPSRGGGEDAAEWAVSMLKRRTLTAVGGGRRIYSDTRG